MPSSQTITPTILAIGASKNTSPSAEIKGNNTFNQVLKNEVANKAKKAPIETAKNPAANGNKQLTLNANTSPKIKTNETPNTDTDKITEDDTVHEETEFANLNDPTSLLNFVNNINALTIQHSASDEKNTSETNASGEMSIESAAALPQLSNDALATTNSSDMTEPEIQYSENPKNLNVGLPQTYSTKLQNSLSDTRSNNQQSDNQVDTNSIQTIPAETQYSENQKNLNVSLQQTYSTKLQNSLSDTSSHNQQSDKNQAIPAEIQIAATMQAAVNAETHVQALNLAIQNTPTESAKPLTGDINDSVNDPKNKLSNLPTQTTTSATQDKSVIDHQATAQPPIDTIDSTSEADKINIVSSANLKSNVDNLNHTLSNTTTSSPPLGRIEQSKVDEVAATEEKNKNDMQLSQSKFQATNMPATADSTTPNPPPMPYFPQLNPVNRVTESAANSNFNEMSQETPKAIETKNSLKPTSERADLPSTNLLSGSNRSELFSDRLNSDFTETHQEQNVQKDSETIDKLTNNNLKTEITASPPTLQTSLPSTVSLPLNEHIAARFGTRAWDQAIGQKIVWMVAGSEQTAQLTLNPPDLGPVQVVLSISDSFVDASFVSSHLDVREAIEAAAPKLREMMDNAGISLSGFSVSAESAQSGNQYHAEKSQNNNQSQARNASNTNEASDSTKLNTPVQRPQPELGLVDTFA